ncbi:MAG: beta-glucosidase BglX [Candidatus Cyclobacteriaceae bacterium M2_1C_046]
MKRLLIAILFACLICSNVRAQTKYEAKIDSILSKMTIYEKVGQLNQYSVGSNLTGPGNRTGEEKIRYDQLNSGGVGSVLNLLGAKDAYEMQKQVVENSRLGIPLIFAFDVVHGYKTIFPIPLGESASWDLEAIQNSARIAAREASAAGIQWTFAPMVDIGRDPRWGRVMEGAGEDPYLGAEIAKARVRGFQGNDLSDPATIAACAKHFAGYGMVEGGQDYNNVYLGKHQLLNLIIPPFKAAEEQGVATFMNAFNDIDGVPATASEYLQRELLKGDWAFDGVVVSDWNSIGELVPHGVAKDNKEAARLAIEAGSDIDMEAKAYINHLEELVKEGTIDEKIIDDAVRRVLLLKYRLGLFDDPYKYFDENREKEFLASEEHMEASRDIARRSIVLLKNENNLLPLNAKKIAVIGPLAKDKDSPIGNWRGAAESNSAVSFYEGLDEAIGDKTVITYAEGVKLSIGPNNFFQQLEIEEEDRSGISEAVAKAREAETVIMVLGETAYMSGEGRSRADIGLPGLQLELLKEVYKANKNIVLVLMNGRPMTIQWEAENIPAILETWHLGSQAGHAIADVLTGKYNPSGKLPMTFPRSVGQIPVYYNHKMTGRPVASPGQVFYRHYNDLDSKPLYPFGYGLSYSTFEYSPIEISSNEITSEEKLKVTVEVTNTSDIAGEEVVQLYIRDKVGSITRPVKELKGFKKLMIRPGETKVVEFEISSDDLSFYRKDLSYGYEPGAYEVFVGPNSQDLNGAEFILK